MGKRRGGTTLGKPGTHGPEEAVYAISVVAELVGMAQPTLRLYERKGLLDPGRTAGGTRRHSQNDVDRLRRIGELVDAGVNLAGVAIILRLESDYRRLDRDLRAARGPRRGTPEITPRPGPTDRR